MILCICSDNYAKKANEQLGGVGYEKGIMAANMLEGNASKYIPIKRDLEGNDMPNFLKGKKYIDFSDDNKYKEPLRELTARIYGKDVGKKPPLGKNPYENFPF